jgi:shikimate dehydrogenase
VTGTRLRLAVLGDPLAFTLSPVLHRAGLQAAGLPGDSEALSTPLDSLGARLRTLAEDGYRGVNLTAPLKQAALEHVAEAAPAARRARSVNTVSFDSGGWRGDTTDGAGFVDLLASLGRSPRDERVVLRGAGGAARSLALALAQAGCARIAATARDPDAAAGAWREIPTAELVLWGSPADRARLADCTLLVNATPLGGAQAPAALERLPRSALVIDLGYREAVTAWVASARAGGLEAYDGLGLLVFQARRSLEIWTGRAIPSEPLAAAVGWPR